jgi:hypothetical protein
VGAFGRCSIARGSQSPDDDLVPLMSRRRRSNRWDQTVADLEAIGLALSVDTNEIAVYAEGGVLLDGVPAPGAVAGLGAGRPVEPWWWSTWRSWCSVIPLPRYCGWLRGRVVPLTSAECGDHGRLGGALGGGPPVLEPCWLARTHALRAQQRRVPPQRDGFRARRRRAGGRSTVGSKG